MTRLIVLLFATALPATALSAIALPAAAQAAPDPGTGAVEEIIVTAARLPLPAADLGARVISAEDLSRPGTATLGQALAGVPGVFADAPGGPGGFASLSLRGTDPNHTLVLIDGIKVNDPTNSRGGAFDPSGLLLFGVERVELLGSAASAIHGADAIGGVLNIVTKSGTDRPEGLVTGSVGTDGMRRISAGLRGPLGPVRGALTLGHGDEGTPRSGNRYEAEQALLRLDAMAGGGTVGLAGRWTRFDAVAFPEDAGGTEFAVIPERERRDGREAGAALHIDLPLGERLRLLADGTISDRWEQVETPAVAPGPRDPFGLPAADIRTEFQRLGATMALLLDAAEDLSLLAGGAVEEEDGESVGALVFGPFTLPAGFALDRTTGAVLTQAAWLPAEGLGGHAGLRVDMPEGAGTEVSPSVGLRWRAGPTLVRAGWAEGFKLPSFYALGNPLVGNPELVPERSRTADLSLSHSFAGDAAVVTAALFHTRIRNIVDFDPGPPPRLVNRETLTARGAEVSLTLTPMRGVTLDGFVSHTDTELSGGAPVRDRPRWQAGAGARWTEGEWSAFAGLRHRGHILDTAIPTGDVRLDPATLVDLSIGWTPVADVTLDLSVTNAFDAADRQRIGTPGPGRRMLAGLRVGF